MADRGFPGPYVHSIPAGEDPMMKGVPKQNTDIGGRANAVPKDKTGAEMKIEHVGGKVT